MKKIRFRGYVNSLFYKITTIYALVLLLMGFWGCYISYTKEHSAIVHRFDRVMSQLDSQYKYVTEDFWRLYMPIFENPNSVYASLRTFYRMDSEEALSPMDKMDLINALRAIMANDDRIRWVALYPGGERTGYLFFAGDSTLTEMPGDFPYREALEQKGASKEIFESHPILLQNSSVRCFAQCGGILPDIRKGSILVGYATDELAPEDVAEPQLAQVRFLLLNDHGIIYDSAGSYEERDPVLEALVSRESGTHIIDGTVYFLQQFDTGTGEHRVFCVASWGDMFRQCLAYTPMIALVVALFWCCSLVIYHWTGRVIRKKTEKIQLGLEKIGCNQLDYRIAVPEESTDEFDTIGASVNQVAARLQDNLHKVYLSKLRQREAELSELQAKFDPHFLYNTLEVIRGRVYENGDDETADIIVKLAQIFRSFIGSEIFVPIREEIDFCNLYLSLLRYRYDNRVKIVYDVDSEILDYGIVRNLLQPILENYFIHGFSADKKDNRLVLNGRLEDENHIRFRIEDNGTGITPQRLAQIKEKLEAAKPSGKGSYGLNNINQRIALFYGPDCGLEIFRNREGGTTIDVRILRLSCEDHQRRLSAEP